MRGLSVSVAVDGDGHILAPTGTNTPYHAARGFEVTGGRIAHALTEADLGLEAVLIEPQADTVTLHYAMEPDPAGVGYPDAAFLPRDTAYTRAAQPLVEASRAIAQQAGGGRAGIEALVAEAEARFDYGHPDARFNDGTDAVPYLSCEQTPGSCVDINTYLVASLRAAGYEAAYFYGYFFPKERDGMTDDGHCWVVTRNGGEILEWDIAHHLKAALGPTRAALNPRPGARVAVTHSMGHIYPGPSGSIKLKLLGEPMRLPPGGVPVPVTLEARLTLAEEAA